MISNIVISSRVRLARNIEGMPFPNKLCDFESASSISKAIYEILGEEFEFRRLKNMTMNQCLLLLEKHIISKELIDNKDISSYALSSDEQISIMINEEDHIREQCIMPGLSLEKCYQRIDEIDDKILDKIDVAFDKKLGFLTACPSNLGTGMRASVMMFLPALTLNGAIKNIIENLEKNGLTVRGYFGEDSTCDGYFYQISNKITLGITEQEILNLVIGNVNKIIEMEESAQKSLININKSVIMDMCYRAYGILTNSYILSTSESVELLSKLRFGVASGLIKLKNEKIIDELYVLIQPAHLQEHYSLDLSPKERDVFRAKFVSETMENKLIKGV